MKFILAGIVVLARALPGSSPPSSSTSRLTSSTYHDPPTVHVRNGTITGLHSKTYNEDFFLGVPYALAPTGQLRFRNPRSYNHTYGGPLQATTYAPECVGYGGDQIGYPVSEDCLYLNVIRPSGLEHAALPVGVWIHGGGLTEGGTRDERYNLSFIVRNSVEIGKPIIGVSIAYRLSAWGFLQSREVSGTGNTNMGLRDQRLALHWLHENIAAFGGDPAKVTIWGESAGAASVGWHLTAYNGRDDGLFRAGIMESGNPVNYNSYHDNTYYQPLYDALLAATGCEDATDSLDCLRHVPYDVINDHFNASEPGDWQPVVDGDLIQRWASVQLREGAFVQVPIIDGANSDEGTAFSPTPVADQADFVKHITDQAGTGPALPANFVPGVLRAYPDDPSYWIPSVAEIGNFTYPPSYGASYRRSAAYFGDAVMIANRRGACQTWAAHGVPAYCYRFNTRPAGIPTYIGVTHFQEVAFVFDNTQGLGYNPAHDSLDPFQHEPRSYSRLAKLMSCSWASFIHDLNPNGFRTRNAASPPWPRYSVDQPRNIVWDANVTALAYTEPDTFRQTGIQWILDHALAYHQ